nr:MAG TPA: hypothetical protein [Caudoviricetes sp.]
MVHAPFPGVYPRLSAVPSVLHRGLWRQIQKSVFCFGSRQCFYLPVLFGISTPLS